MTIGQIEAELDSCKKVLNSYKNAWHDLITILKTKEQMMHDHKEEINKYAFCLQDMIDVAKYYNLIEPKEIKVKND